MSEKIGGQKNSQLKHPDLRKCHQKHKGKRINSHSRTILFLYGGSANDHRIARIYSTCAIETKRRLFAATALPRAWDNIRVLVWFLYSTS